MSETITVTGTARSAGVIRPRILLLSNGKPIGVPASMQADIANLNRAGTFSAAMPIIGDPPYWFDPPDSTSAVEVDCELQLGFRGEGQAESEVSFQSVIRGTLSSADIDLPNRIVMLSGRDYSARLVDKQYAGESYLNMTASDAISKIAADAGLSADVDATTGLVGQFYQYEHKQGARASAHQYQTQWDFCVGMQKLYGYDLWVSGKTLHFKKPDTTSAPIRLQWSGSGSATPFPKASFAALRLSRNMVLNRDVSVTVRSWDYKQRTLHSATYPKTVSSSATSYTVNEQPGRTQDQLVALAGQKYAEVLAHARTVNCVVRINRTILPRQRVSLQGTGTTFDQTYSVDQVTFRVSAQEATQTLALRNRAEVSEEVGS